MRTLFLLLFLLSSLFVAAQGNSAPGVDTALVNQRADRETQLLHQRLLFTDLQYLQVHALHKFYFRRYLEIKDQDQGNPVARRQKFETLEQQRLLRLQQQLTTIQFDRYQALTDSLRRLLPGQH